LEGTRGLDAATRVSSLRLFGVRVLWHAREIRALARTAAPEAAPNLLRQLAEKEAFWAARFLTITQRVAIAAVVGAMGKYFGFVVLAFIAGFRGGNDQRDIPGWRCFFHDLWVPLELYRNCPSDCSMGVVTSISR
jgi:hypothetical protein